MKLIFSVDDNTESHRSVLLLHEVNTPILLSRVRISRSSYLEDKCSDGMKGEREE